MSNLTPQVPHLEPGHASPWRASFAYVFAGAAIVTGAALLTSVMPVAEDAVQPVRRALLSAGALAVLAFPFAAVSSARPPRENAWLGGLLRGSSVPLRLWGGAFAMLSPVIGLWLLHRPWMVETLEDLGDRLDPYVFLGVTIILALTLMLAVGEWTPWPLVLVLWPPTAALAVVAVAHLAYRPWFELGLGGGSAPPTGGLGVALRYLLALAMGVAAARLLPIGRRSQGRAD